MQVAHAAPSTPSAGAPRLPNTSTQFTAAFTTFGGDERDHDRRHQRHGLQVAPECGVQQQRQQAQRDDVEVVVHQRQHGRIEAPHAEVGANQAGSQADRERESQSQPDAVAQPAAALAAGAGAVRLRNEGVESEQQAHSEYAEREEERAADADRADRLRAEPPHHGNVDELHRHPAHLGDDDGGGKCCDGTQLLAEQGE